MRNEPLVGNLWIMRAGFYSVGLIALTVLLLYGPSLNDGLLLDDFNHRAELHDAGWSLHELVHAAHLGNPRHRVHLWWQEQADLYFFRPLAFLLMKAEYIAAGWRPVVMHGFSLLWLVLGGVLVMHFAARLIRPGPWAVLAGLLFVIHPANALTARWIACQNQQMAGGFMLLALLLHGRWMGWWRALSPSDEPAERAAGVISRAMHILRCGTGVSPVYGWASRPATSHDIGVSPQSPCIHPRGAVTARTAPQLNASRRWLLPVGVLLCFAAALACREDGVALLPILIGGDLCLRAKAAPRRWALYAGLLGVLAAWYLVRRMYLGDPAVPARPYAWPPGDPGFMRFAVDKLLYYLLGLFAGVPIVGFAGLPALQAHPLAFYGSTALLLTAVVWLSNRAHRRSVAMFGWLLLTLPLLPSLPVFPSSHHLYLSSAGAVLMVLAGLAAVMDRRGVNRQAHEPRASRRRPVAIFAGLSLWIALAIGLQAAQTVAMKGFAASGQLPVREVVELGRPMRAGDRLFFINLPMLAFNLMPAVEEQTGASPLTGYALTFATDFLRMVEPTRIRREDAHTLRIETTGRPYFHGIAGQSLLEGARRDGMFRPGETFATPDFTVEIVQADEAGVSGLRFTFVRPLDDPIYHFYLGSEAFAAYPLHFDAIPR